jgi:hypothetical protein
MTLVLSTRRAYVSRVRLASFCEGRLEGPDRIQAQEPYLAARRGLVPAGMSSA